MNTQEQQTQKIKPVYTVIEVFNISKRKFGVNCSYKHSDSEGHYFYILTPDIPIRGRLKKLGFFDIFTLGPRTYFSASPSVNKEELSLNLYELETFEKLHFVKNYISSQFARVETKSETKLIFYTLPSIKYSLKTFEGSFILKKFNEDEELTKIIYNHKNFNILLELIKEEIKEVLQ